MVVRATHEELSLLEKAHLTTDMGIVRPEADDDTSQFVANGVPA